MLAAKVGPAAGSAEQEFDFIFTSDRDIILECAQALMLRIASLRDPNGQAMNADPAAAALASRPR
jgi:hypothetical protein